jgi:hypothetical protein
VRSVTGEWWNDDLELLGSLGEALHAAQQVPAAFVSAGKAVWVAPDVDAELAELIYDSEREPAAARADTATLRALSFASSTQTIEVELIDGALSGQLVPPARATVELERQDSPTVSTTADDQGYFSMQVVPHGPFRLRCRADTGAIVVTSWITI